MKTIFNFLSVFLVAGLVSSCYTGYTFKTTSYCYHDKPENIASKLNLNGYYSEQEVITYNVGFPSKQVIDTAIRNYIFYPDGIVLYGFKEELNKKRNGSVYKGGDHSQFWGRFIVSNDTIKAHFIVGTLSGPPNKAYAWFTIKKTTAVKKICFKWGEPITPLDVINYKDRAKHISEATFVHYDNLPDPNLSWIKKKKWFWCDKKQYKIWKKEMKRKKTQE